MKIEPSMIRYVESAVPGEARLTVAVVGPPSRSVVDRTLVIVCNPRAAHVLIDGMGTGATGRLIGHDGVATAPSADVKKAFHALARQLAHAVRGALAP